MSNRRILIAPAAFKGCKSALETAHLIRDFLQPHPVALDVCPIADGGDDTLQALAQADPQYEWRSVTVTGPLPSQRVTSRYLVHPQRQLAVLEAAQAHGMRLLPNGKPAPITATSYGVGEALAHILAREPARRVIVSVGGSASTDAGLGALQALGFRFYQAPGELFEQPPGGGDLLSIARIDRPTDPPWQDQEILIATDVVNPLLGNSGAARIFAPQKGATPDMVEALEAGMTHAAGLLAALTGKHLSDLSGAGAAGGLAFGLTHLPNSRIIPGTPWLFEAIGLADRIGRADLVITGEGRLDTTSFSGKATGQLLAMADGKPVLFLCGQAASDIELPPQIRVQVITPDNLNFDTACRQVDALLIQALHEAREWLSGRLQLAL